MNGTFFEAFFFVVLGVVAVALLLWAVVGAIEAFLKAVFSW